MTPKTWILPFSRGFLPPDPKPFLFEPKSGVFDLEKATM
jgi:hypothetical protein